MSALSYWRHVMVDIETMGTSRRAPVMAIGLVPFQLHSEQCKIAQRETWAEFRVSLADNLAVDRIVDGETVEWWLRQSEAVRTALVAEPRQDAAGAALDVVDYLQSELF